MPSVVTECHRSYYPRTIWTHNFGLGGCLHQVVHCLVLEVAHSSHDWLSGVGRRLWVHCNGVSGSERRAAGASATSTDFSPAVLLPAHDARPCIQGLGQGGPGSLHVDRG